MRTQIEHSENGRPDGLCTEGYLFPHDTYEVPDETAQRWPEAQAAWREVQQEMHAFADSHGSEGRQEAHELWERQQAEFERKHGK